MKLKIKYAFYTLHVRCMVCSTIRCHSWYMRHARWRSMCISHLLFTVYWEYVTSSAFTYSAMASWGNRKVLSRHVRMHHFFLPIYMRCCSNGLEQNEFYLSRVRTYTLFLLERERQTSEFEQLKEKNSFCETKICWIEETVIFLWTNFIFFEFPKSRIFA